MPARENKDLEFSIIQDELKGKLSSLQTTQRNQRMLFQTELREEKTRNDEKMRQTFHTLCTNCEHLCRLYDTKSTRGFEEIKFMYQQPTDDVFTEENSFTRALTEYTKRQFFEGIADLAGAKDHTKYDLLDVNKPETLLIKGESEEIKSRDRNELQRLQQIYKSSQEERIKAEMSTNGLKKAVECAENQLNLLKSGSFNKAFERLQTHCEKISEEIANQKKELMNCFESEVAPLLTDMQDLHGVKVLRGNYDLKTSRQDYFLSKQTQVIEQLLHQCSRNYFLTMLFEREWKRHRDSYHLLASSKAVLENELKGIQHRIKLLSDPILISNSCTKETISSRDEFACRLHDSLVKSSSDQIYKTYDNVLQQSKILAQETSDAQRKVYESQDQQNEQLLLLGSTLKATEEVMKKKHEDTNEELSKLVEDMEERLALAEVQVNEIIKDVMSKKKILAGDSLRELERTIFPNFFNDPERLKRTLMELQSRVDICT